MAKSNRSSSSIKSTSGKATPKNSHKLVSKSAQTGRYMAVGITTSMKRESRMSEAQKAIARTVSQVRSIIDSMDADQKEIDSLRAETRANLDKTQSVLDTF